MGSETQNRKHRERVTGQIVWCPRLKRFKRTYRTREESEQLAKKVHELRSKGYKGKKVAFTLGITPELERQLFYDKRAYNRALVREKAL